MQAPFFVAEKWDSEELGHVEAGIAPNHLKEVVSIRAQRRMS
jgi:hypothetical protein